VAEPVFRGTSFLSLDAKGRLAIPAKQRERLSAGDGPGLIVTVGTDGCLLIFPSSTWEEVERRLADLPSLDPAVQAVRRLYLGHADDVEIDSQGRILLSQYLRDLAGLDKRVALVGQGIKLELWDEQKWKDLTQANLNNPQISATAQGSVLGQLRI
jgi:MraZ protein